LLPTYLSFFRVADLFEGYFSGIPAGESLDLVDFNNFDRWQITCNMDNGEVGAMA
jgi:hypothetical protein